MIMKYLSWADTIQRKYWFIDFHENNSDLVFEFFIAQKDNID